MIGGELFALPFWLHMLRFSNIFRHRAIKKPGPHSQASRQMEWPRRGSLCCQGQVMVSAPYRYLGGGRKAEFFWVWFFPAPESL